MILDEIIESANRESANARRLKRFGRDFVFLVDRVADEISWEMKSGHLASAVREDPVALECTLSDCENAECWLTLPEQ